MSSRPARAGCQTVELQRWRSGGRTAGPSLLGELAIARPVGGCLVVVLSHHPAMAMGRWVSVSQLLIVPVDSLMEPMGRLVAVLSHHAAGGRMSRWQGISGRIRATAGDDHSRPKQAPVPPSQPARAVPQPPHRSRVGEGPSDTPTARNAAIPQAGRQAGRQPRFQPTAGTRCPVTPAHRPKLTAAGWPRDRLIPGRRSGCAAWPPSPQTQRVRRASRRCGTPRSLQGG